MAGDDVTAEGAVDTVEHERRIVDLLSRALELDGADRGRFLDHSCAGDRALRDELESMLEEESEVPDGFLESPAVADLDEEQLFENDQGLPFGAPFSSRHSGGGHIERFGPYRVLSILGQGGMGTVYLAEQREPVRRRVALKILDAVHDRRRLKRFAAEGQALARLAHPNIASLYEVGATAEGHPFVAMELVEGVAITAWCDQRRLSLDDRIELFFDVCAGVRHAHEKGVLHRDLKPANVLVTEVDGKATAKVIDFGIARALGEPLLTDVDTQPMTLENQIIGSPIYMCPEVAGGKRDVDTRSDVYALGLLLYELLIGVLPFDTQVNLVELLRRIAKGDLPVPSARFAELEVERRKQLADLRSSTASGLSRRLHGDLDAIAEKTVTREPEERYDSPAALATDLRRHLDVEPVGARPPSFFYLFGRSLRRRSGMVLAVGSLILALAVGFVARTREARRANLEVQRAEEALAEAQRVSRFLVDLFEIADPERDPGEPLDVRQLLDRGAEKLQDELRDQPLARARFLHTIGEIYTKMALFEPAERLVAEALEIRETELSPDHPEVLESVNQLGVVYRRQNRLDDAEPLLRRVLAAREAVADPDQVAIALALNNLGNLLWSRSQYQDAEAVHRRALAIRERELTPDHPDLATTLNNLGAQLQGQGRYAEAHPILRRAAEIFAAALGADHPRYAAALFNLAMMDAEVGQWGAAEDHCRKAAALWEAAYGVGHPRTLSARSRLGSLLRKQGRYQESVGVYSATRRVWEEALGADDPGIHGLLTGLAIAEGFLGELDSAEADLRKVLELNLKAHGEDHRSTIGARSNLAWLTWRRGRYAEAEAAHRRVLEIKRRIHGSEHRSTASTLHLLALAVADQGRDYEAEPLLRQALEIREATRGKDHLEVADTLYHLGRLVHRAGRLDEARALFERALRIRRRRLPADHPDLEGTVAALASLQLIQSFGERLRAPGLI